MKKMDHYFDYLIPESFRDTVQPGTRVLVPFGRGNKTLEAYVMTLRDTDEVPKNLKSIYSLIESRPILSKYHLKLVHWMKKTLSLQIY